MVRCKFRCHCKQEYRDANGKLTGVKVGMSPVYYGSEENEKFFEATPSGEINFYSVNPAVAEVIIENKEYYIDITPAE